LQNYVQRGSLNVGARYYQSIVYCFRGLKKREVDRIIVPLFNSTIGCIPETVQNLNGHRICGQEILPINLYLAGSCGLGSVKYVHSKREVLQQCGRLLDKLEVELVFEKSSAAAAMNVRSGGCLDRAAIVSKYAAEIYGLDVLKEKVQDKKKNRTEFVILGLDN
jgi:prephenate dehydratase